jgi:hypothetical protein
MNVRVWPTFRAWVFVWLTTQCRRVGVYKCFRGACHHHLRGRRPSMKTINLILFSCSVEMLRKDFPSSLCVQTGSGAHPASCTMGTRGPFPGAKGGRGVTLSIDPHLVPRLKISRSYTSSPPSAFVACSGTDLAGGAKLRDVSLVIQQIKF